MPTTPSPQQPAPQDVQQSDTVDQKNKVLVYLGIGFSVIVGLVFWLILRFTTYP